MVGFIRKGRFFTMSDAVDEHFERIIKNLVQTGRYNNASEVPRAGLRFAEEQETKLKTQSK